MNDLINKLIQGNDDVIRKQYEVLVVSKIRKKYSQDEENAILRKKIANIDSGEFEEYNAYVENCKNEIKKKLGL